MHSVIPLCVSDTVFRFKLGYLHTFIFYSFISLFSWFASVCETFIACEKFRYKL